MEYIGGRITYKWSAVENIFWIISEFLEAKLGWISQPKFCSEIHLYMILAHVFKFS